MLEASQRNVAARVRMGSGSRSMRSSTACGGVRSCSAAARSKTLAEALGHGEEQLDDLDGGRVGTVRARAMTTRLRQVLDNFNG
jgi:hypothetical protein